MKHHIVAIITLFSISIYGQTTSNLANIERGTIYSDVLKMDKSYQIFLPESYNYSDKSTYPVVYLIDGDYNFYYQTGIIESLANVSEKIPELIVVGISDNGNEGYRKDCTLQSVTNPNGNAENFMSYIENELKPEIEKKFRVSTYQILVGHSLGGLFATNVFLKQTKAFSAYIAIDPSLWWDNKSSSILADSLFKPKEDLQSKYFITLADSKQMGVHHFVEVLEKYYPDSQKWTFKYYENENHGSVGIISISEGLLKIFEDWELKRDQFYDLKTSTDVVNYYKNLSEHYQSTLRIPPISLTNIIYYYYRKGKMEDLAIIEKEILASFPSSMDDYYSKLASFMTEDEKYDEAQIILKKSIDTNANAYKSYDSLSKLYYAKSEYEIAKQNSITAIEIAKELKARQWQLNELESNLKKIEMKIGE